MQRIEEGLGAVGVVGVGLQAVEECLRLLGCDRDYAELNTEERVELLSGYLASPPPKDKIQVDLRPFIVALRF